MGYRLAFRKRSRVSSVSTSSTGSPLPRQLDRELPRQRALVRAGLAGQQVHAAAHHVAAARTRQPAHRVADGQNFVADLIHVQQAIDARCEEMRSSISRPECCAKFR
jgi:hypothetical protein